MTVFADTFALIAWLNPRDDAHAVVAAYLLTTALETKPAIALYNKRHEATA